MNEKTEKMLAEIFSEEQIVPYELRQKLHDELLKHEKAIMTRNLVIAVIMIFAVAFFAVSFAYIFSGSIIAIIGIVFFSAAAAAAAVTLAIAAGKYEIKTIQKGLGLI